MVTMITTVPTITDVTTNSLVTLVTEVSKGTEVISFHRLQQPAKQGRQAFALQQAFPVLFYFIIAIEGAVDQRVSIVLSRHAIGQTVT